MPNANVPVPPSDVLTTDSCAGRRVLVNVHVMLSDACGVNVKLVPEPDGSTVDEPANELVHAIELAYWPSVPTEPAAIASLSV